MKTELHTKISALDTLKEGKNYEADNMFPDEKSLILKLFSDTKIFWFILYEVTIAASTVIYACNFSFSASLAVLYFTG